MAAALQAWSEHPEAPNGQASCRVVSGSVRSSERGGGEIVTWEGSGFIARSNGANAFDVVPPPGTPLAVSLSFDPAQTRPTVPGSPGFSNCLTVDVSASVSIGGYTYTTAPGSGGFPGSLGFTNAMLPGTSCAPGAGFTQFSLHTLASPPGTPWSLDPGSVMILSFRDPVNPDAFSSTPPPLASLFLTPTVLGDTVWTFSGPIAFEPVDQPVPVPEPATVTLFGLGLAALMRKTRALRRRDGN